MNPRRRSREVALQILYRHDISTEPAPAGLELAQELVKHFDHFQGPPASREFAAELVSGTLTRREELDRILEEHASHWKVGRMSAIDRCLLRMATYEMQNFPDIPHSVTLNEAIELAKQFGSQESPAFINGLLDAISRKLRQEAAAT
jgi:N utilization substance protein B